jgi:hypothetical protein
MSNLPDYRVMTSEEVFAEEREAIGIDANKQPTSLCLSGGGIRSAAFCSGGSAGFGAAWNYCDTSTISPPCQEVVISALG